MMFDPPGLQSSINMIQTSMLAKRRIAARTALLQDIAAASQEHGATAFHLLGSLSRQTADAFSDIDAWLTFPDDLIDAAVRSRHTLYRNVGDLLLTHEAASNRPVGGVYTLALYQTSAGPIQVDWYLAPQRTSRVAHQATSIFERVAVPRGEWRLDSEARQQQDRARRINWLIGMLFIAIKTLLRGGDTRFLWFLGAAYRETQESYRLGEMPVTYPTSLATVGDMLRQLAPEADDAQRRTIQTLGAFLHSVDEAERP
jgi:hypothetical protein